MNTETESQLSSLIETSPLSSELGDGEEGGLGDIDMDEIPNIVDGLPLFRGIRPSPLAPDPRNTPPHMTYEEYEIQHAIEHAEERAASSSSEENICYVCTDPIQLSRKNTYRAPCGCTGETKYLHRDCFAKLYIYHKKCGICGLYYAAGDISDNSGSRPRRHRNRTDERVTFSLTDPALEADYQIASLKLKMLGLLFVLSVCYGVFVYSFYPNIHARKNYTCTKEDGYVDEIYIGKYSGIINLKVTISETNDNNGVPQYIDVYLHRTCPPTLESWKNCPTNNKELEESFSKGHSYPTCLLDLNDITNSVIYEESTHGSDTSVIMTSQEAAVSTIVAIAFVVLLLMLFVRYNTKSSRIHRRGVNPV
jgi:hypothetical protein